MNVHDKAHELARAIQESQEFREYKRCKEETDADPDTKRMLSDFRQRQFELQTKMFSGEEMNQEEADKIEKLYEVLNMNPAISRYFAAEQGFTVLMDDIQRITFGPVEELIRDSKAAAEQ